ncbi:MAG: hypothetical protein ACOC8E_04645 [Planctomycetota bacterium]
MIRRDRGRPTRETVPRADGLATAARVPRAYLLRPAGRLARAARRDLARRALTR